MKKIVSILLAAALIFSILPSAFAVGFSSTCDQKSDSKRFLHVDDEETALKQQLVEMLADAMSYFSSPNYYYEGIWNEAQTLYKNQVQIIYSCTDIDELLTESLFGYMPNDEFMETYIKLSLLSELNKHEVRKAADLVTMKKELLLDIAAQIKEYFHRADFGDFYWDKIVGYKDECVAEIKGAKTFSDFVLAKSEWEYFFEFEEYDPEEYAPWEYLEKDILSKNEMSDLASLFSDMLYDDLDDYEAKGYNVESDAVDDALAAFEKAAQRAHYAKEINQAYEKAKTQLAALVGAEPQADREAVTVSVMRRALKRLREVYFSFDKSNYSTSNWFEIEDIYSEAEQTIYDAAYQDEIDDKFFGEVLKHFKQVKTYAAELKGLKAELINGLKEYLGDPAYNQAKVKKLVPAGAKAINACKSIDKAVDIHGKYIDALEKAMNRYKIIVSKAGKGAVSKSTVVDYGDSYTVKIIPVAGYKITSITVDGRKVKLVNAYTFADVTKAHSIRVTFGK